MTKKSENNKEQIQEELIQNEEMQIKEEKITQNKEIQIEEEISQNEETNKNIKLKIKMGFIDKYNESIFYKTDDIVEFEKSRAEELLKDPRKLVCICK